MSLVFEDKVKVGKEFTLPEKILRETRINIKAKVNYPRLKSGA